MVNRYKKEDNIKEMLIMKIKKEETSISVEFTIDEWRGIIKDDPKKFVDVVNGIEDGYGYITFPSEECFGDVKGGIANGGDDLEHRSLRNLIRKCEDDANNNPKPPVNPTKVVEENREALLKEIEAIIDIDRNLSEKEKAAAMKKGETLVNNLVNIYSYAEEKGLNISDTNDLNELRKKIAEVMEEAEE